MKIERLREVTEKIGALASGQRIDVTFMVGTEKLRLSVLSSTDERYEKIQEAITEFKDDFVGIDHHRLPDASLDWKYLDKIFSIYQKKYRLELKLRSVL